MPRKIFILGGFIYLRVLSVTCRSCGSENLEKVANRIKLLNRSKDLILKGAGWFKTTSGKDVYCYEQVVKRKQKLVSY